MTTTDDPFDHDDACQCEGCERDRRWKAWAADQDEDVI